LLAFLGHKRYYTVSLTNKAGSGPKKRNAAAIQALALTLSGAAAMAAAYDDTEVAEMKVNSNGSLSESLTDA